MAIFVACGCGRQFQTSDENAGRRATCPGCRRPLIVPRPAAGVRLPSEFVRGGTGEAPQGSARMVGGEAIAPVTSRSAMASVALGLLSLFLLFFAGLPAIFLGIRGFREIRDGRGLVGGRPLALLGTLLGLFGSTAMPLVFLLPLARSAREASNHNQCTNQLTRIALALHGFHGQYGQLPPGAIFDKKGQALLSWRVAILPFLGPAETELYRKFHLDEPWDSHHNLQVMREGCPAVFACPSDDRLGTTLTTYQVLIGPRTLFTGKKRGVPFSAVTDGTSNTLMVVEGAMPVPWTAPMELTFNDPNGQPLSGAGSRHPDGFNVVMADGSIRFFRDWIPTTVFNGLATRDGAELVSPP